MWTIILLLPNKNYHVCLTDDPEKYLDSRNRVKGVFAHKNNKGKCKIIRAFKGDYQQKIRCFGAKKFCQCMNDEDHITQLFTNLFS